MIKIKTFLKKIITRIRFEMFLRKIPEPSPFFDENLFPFKRARAYSKKTDSDGSHFGGTKDKVDYIDWLYDKFKKQSRKDRNNCGFMGMVSGLGADKYRKDYLNTLHRMLEYEERTGRNLLSDARDGCIILETIEYPVKKTAEIVDEKTIPDDIKERKLSNKMKEEKEKEKPEEKQQETPPEETGYVAEPYEPLKDTEEIKEEIPEKIEKKSDEKIEAITKIHKKLIKTQKDFENEKVKLIAEQVKLIKERDPDYVFPERGKAGWGDLKKRLDDSTESIWLHDNPGYSIDHKDGKAILVIPETVEGIS